MQNQKKRKMYTKEKRGKRRVVLFVLAFSLMFLGGLFGYYLHKESQTTHAQAVTPPHTSEGVEAYIPVRENVVLPTEVDIPGIKLVMVGDVLMHLRVTQSGIKEDGTYNYDPLFEHVKEDIEAADVAVINQEIILGGPELGYSGYPIFNTAYEVADAISNAGFDVVLHATNHTMDKGKTGLMNCLNYWDSNFPEIAVLGANRTQEEADEIYIYEQDGIKLAMLNYTYGLNGMPMPSDMPFAVDMMVEEEMAADIARAEEAADFTIVYLHWGNEYQTYASSNQKMWANFFLENGVDLIIGTHPHVIQPVEWYEDEDGHRMLVYYSIGNFINSTASSGNGVGARVVGAMAEVEIIRDGNGEVVIDEYGVTPLVTQIEAGYGKITTYKLEDYSQELADSNQMSRKDPGFSYEYCLELCRKVFGDLY